MDRARFSAIAHTGLSFLNPLPASFFDEVAGSVRLAPGERLIELGCGKAELLLRLAERHGVAATGIDRSAHFLDEGRRAAAVRLPDGAVELLQADAAGWPLGSSRWAMSICIGSGPLASVAALAAAVPAGGWVLAGDAHWRGDPPPDLLAALGCTRGDLPEAHALEAEAERAGLVPILLRSASTSEWDAYEAAWLANVERWAEDHPLDPERDAFLARARAGNERHRRFGPLGFTVGLFRKR
ncbi:SAM-dependent methyltransferase [Vulgatibacter sp.]|uniref:SAM-dependent methyltransferase n=1 Tax=Vulgatibacter sp. TaxID=1971226 RepID=UPI003562251D